MATHNEDTALEKGASMTQGQNNMDEEELARFVRDFLLHGRALIFMAPLQNGIQARAEVRPS